MKPVSKVVFATCLFLFLTPGVFAQTNSFYVYFKQGDKRINIVDYQVELKKSPFQIYIEYTNPIDIRINASSKSTNFYKASNGLLYHQMPGFSGDAIPESFFLNANTITLSDNKHFIWNQSDTQGNPNFKSDEGRYVCYIDIKYLFEVSEAKVYKPEDAKEDIFMVFLYLEKEKTGELIEIQREAVKIKWVDLYEENTKAYLREKKLLDKDRIHEAKIELRRKQKLAAKEEKALKKLEEKKLKKEEKEKTE